MTDRWTVKVVFVSNRISSSHLHIWKTLYIWFPTYKSPAPNISASQWFETWTWFPGYQVVFLTHNKSIINHWPFFDPEQLQFTYYWRAKTWSIRATIRSSSPSVRWLPGPPQVCDHSECLWSSSLQPKRQWSEVSCWKEVVYFIGNGRRSISFPPALFPCSLFR